MKCLACNKKIFEGEKTRDTLGSVMHAECHDQVVRELKSLYSLHEKPPYKWEDKNESN